MMIIMMMMIFGGAAGIKTCCVIVHCHLEPRLKCCQCHLDIFFPIIMDGDDDVDDEKVEEVYDEDTCEYDLDAILISQLIRDQSSGQLSLGK